MRMVQGRWSPGGIAPALAGGGPAAPGGRPPPPGGGGAGAAPPAAGGAGAARGERLGAPWLAGELAGRAHAREPPKRRRGRSSALGRAATGWIGLLLMLAGAALTATTFMHSTVVASLGLAMMGVGLWR